MSNQLVPLTLLITIIVINLIDNRAFCNPKTNSEVSDCYSLCFGVNSCIEECESGFETKVRRRPILDYGSLTADDIKPSKARKVGTRADIDKPLKSYELYPSHCGLKQRAAQRTRNLKKFKETYPGTGGMGRIVGGEDALPNEFPWLVSLQLQSPGKPLKHFCGAAILNEYYIITAAHCTETLVGKEDTVVIKVGINNWAETGQTMLPEKFIVHKDWSSEHQVNDISLIKVKNPIQFEVNSRQEYTVNAICLPEADDPDPEGHCQLAGWGQFGENEPTVDWLQKITMPLWKRSKCAVNYEEYMTIRGTHICAGGKGGQDSCMGDSGGPLIQTHRERSVQIGVVSFGIPCAVKGLPGVYTHVAKFLDWIQDHMI